MTPARIWTRIDDPDSMAIAFLLVPHAFRKVYNLILTLQQYLSTNLGLWYRALPVPPLLANWICAGDSDSASYSLEAVLLEVAIPQ